MEKKIYKNHELCRGCKNIGFKPVKMCHFLGSYCKIGATIRKSGYCKMREEDNTTR